MQDEVELVIESGSRFIPMRFQASSTASQPVARFPADLLRYEWYARGTNVSSIFKRRINFPAMGVDIRGLLKRNRVFPSRSVQRTQADVPSQFGEKEHGIYPRLEPSPC